MNRTTKSLDRLQFLLEIRLLTTNQIPYSNAVGELLVLRTYASNLRPGLYECAFCLFVEINETYKENMKFYWSKNLRSYYRRPKIMLEYARIEQLLPSQKKYLVRFVHNFWLKITK